MKPVLLGQAPSRAGDGRPFSGPSGRRLCALLDHDYEYDFLAHTFDLQNCLPDPVDKDFGKKGDPFDFKAARANWLMYAEGLTDGRRVIACGKQVARVVGMGRPYVFDSQQVLLKNGVWVWAHCFPHPSGISHFWNDSENVQKAADELARIITLARSPGA